MSDGHHIHFEARPGILPEAAFCLEYESRDALRAALTKFFRVGHLRVMSPDGCILYITPEGTVRLYAHADGEEPRTVDERSLQNFLQNS